MNDKTIPNKMSTIRLTVAEIKKLPVEMQQRIKGAIDVLEIQKAQKKSE